VGELRMFLIRFFKGWEDKNNLEVPMQQLRLVNRALFVYIGSLLLGNCLPPIDLMSKL